MIIIIIIIIIIITTTCHDLPKSRRGSLVKSDYSRTIIQHTPLSPCTSHLHLDIQQLRPFYSLPQPHHVKTSNPSPGDKPPERGRAVWKKHRNQQKWPHKDQSSTYALGLYIPSHLSHCHTASTVISLLPKTTFTPSIQPIFGLPRTLHQHLSSHSVLVYFLHVSTPSHYSDAFYSRTPFLFQLFYAPLHS